MVQRGGQAVNMDGCLLRTAVESGDMTVTAGGKFGAEFECNQADTAVGRQVDGDVVQSSFTQTQQWGADGVFPIEDGDVEAVIAAQGDGDAVMLPAGQRGNTARTAQDVVAAREAQAAEVGVINIAFAFGSSKTVVLIAIGAVAVRLVEGVVVGAQRGAVAAEVGGHGGCGRWGMTMGHGQAGQPQNHCCF